jgi:apolipoprotein N-acyltransferase
VTTAVIRYAAILASALMFALYARVEQPWALLGWVALVPWLATLDRERSIGASIGSGVAMSVAFVLAVFPWVASAVSRYTHVSPLFSFGLLMLAAPLLQPQLVVFAAVRHGLARRGGRRVATSIAAACAWVGMEWLCPRVFGDTIGHGLFPFPTLRQGADLAGAAGLTFVVVLVNECVYEATRQLRRAPRRALRAMTVATLLVSVLAAYGALRWRQVTDGGQSRRPFTAALVQANLGDYEGLRARLGAYEAVRTILSTHQRLSRPALAGDDSGPPVDLLVWPETVYPTTFGMPKSSDGATLDEDIRRFVKGAGVPLLFGTYDRDRDREFNAAVLVQQDGGGAIRSDVYRKRRLFPLTEEVPVWLDRPFIRSRLPWLGTWVAGDEARILTLRRSDGDALRLAVLICLDAVDPSLALDAVGRGANLILTLSNDGWFTGSRGARLHLVVSAFRSIETRLPQLRATNTGISAVITPTGELIAQSRVDEPAVLVGTVNPGTHADTLMTRLGDWFGPATAVAALVLFLFGARRS